MLVSSHCPANQTGRDPTLALASDDPDAGAKIDASKSPRLPVAVTRSDWMRKGRPVSGRLNEAA